MKLDRQKVYKYCEHVRCNNSRDFFHAMNTLGNFKKKSEMAIEFR